MIPEEGFCVGTISFVQTVDIVTILVTKISVRSRAGLLVVNNNVNPKYLGTYRHGICLLHRYLFMYFNESLCCWLIVNKFDIIFIFDAT